MTLLETTQYGNPIINIAVFAIFVVATLGIVIAVTRQKSKASPGPSSSSNSCLGRKTPTRST